MDIYIYASPPVTYPKVSGALTWKQVEGLRPMPLTPCKAGGCKAAGCMIAD